jgi:hypothetical protein
MQGLATRACEMNRGRENSENVEVGLLEVPTFETLYGTSAESSDAAFQPLPPVPKRGIDTTVMILHSSGMLLSHM